MKKKCLLFLSLAALLAFELSAQLTLRVIDIPDNTPFESQIYVAGTFNGWQPGSEGYALEFLGEETYEITFSPQPGNLKFKFTRGSWETVEGNASGGFLPDRSYEYAGGPDTLELQILSWENGGDNSTAAENVRILDESFDIPQLNRTRRIWIYLPPDYEASGKHYPVLYMQDGQNVFDAATAFAGEWEVDESLNRLFGEGDEGIIVVAIDNGGSQRINEYSPWQNPNYGGGEGEAYVDFLVEELKPHIDSKFRTRPEREFTGIMGSSMGGLISLYAAIEHQDVFGKAGIFSASFWFSGQAYTHVAHTGKQKDMRIYLIAGGQEGGGGSQIEDMEAMYHTLLGAGFSQEEVKMTGHEDGQHSEWYWARESPEAYSWLFAGAGTTGLKPGAPVAEFRIFPNPAGDRLTVETDRPLAGLSYQILLPDGKAVGRHSPLEGKQVSVSGLKSGMYLLAFYNEEGRLLFVGRLARAGRN